MSGNLARILSSVDQISRVSLNAGPDEIAMRTPLGISTCLSDHLRSLMKSLLAMTAEVSALRLTFEPDRGSQGFLVKLRYRSEEHPSELQSLMRISYTVFR